MAKARSRLTAERDRPGETSPAADALPRWVVPCRRVALAVLGGLVVYVAYYPSDSVQVENGDALWFVALAVCLATLTVVTEPWMRFAGVQANGTRQGTLPSDRCNASVSGLLGSGLVIDVLAWNLAAWMMFAALATCPPGNLREATNEAWFWVAGAGVLTSARRLLTDRPSQMVMVSLLFAVAAGMAVHALHQQWISLPATRAAYLADPDAVLRSAGIDAPPGTARRMVFANRLLDGGPTGTFALANSLAAILLVAVLVPAGVLWRWRHRHRHPAVTIGFGALLLLAVAALIATRSRSAILASLIALAWLWMPSGVSGQGADRRRKAGLVKLSLGVVGIAAAFVVGVLLFGDEEWMSAAPASLEFRLRYWKSTLALLAEHPWLGAGPGGFQSMYLRYRLPIASETIADPHNFVFETLASGGWIAGVLLAALVWAIVRAARHEATSPQPATEVDLAAVDSAAASSVTQVKDGSRWMASGAGVALLLVWLLVAASGQLQDFQAAVFGIPVAIAAGYLLHHESQRMNQSQWSDTQAKLEIRKLVSAILLAIMIHLTVSGGWTVPGVALAVWISASMLCHVDGVTGRPGVASQALGRRQASRLALGGLVVGGALLLTLRLVSIGPAQSSSLAQQHAEDAVRRGLGLRAERESERAVQADPWGVASPLWRSELFRSRLVGQGDRPADRREWLEAMETAVRRAGDNPLIERAAGEQSLHLYQRYGREEDLARAEDLIFRALAGNPTDVSLVAQAAAISRARAKTAESMELLARARELSLLGGNLVRDLGLQHIFVVKPRGASVRTAPDRRPVKEVFRAELSRIDEPLE
ncbi:O-antigen ligase family protein [Roseiconus nitratireducens]|uniref:O-antigen ligase family protein n=1 Tax=Roseiconus nitratireducens TaxID=2605748 RepID=A0A5M6CVP0_9BACT|nr:O-antigen ligase family protein [Roseiconus nitratireducens]KAA5539304.1 O-antigen ligase family protein [Roseiconus nitratireducens]